MSAHHHDKNIFSFPHKHTHTKIEKKGEKKKKKKKGGWGGGEEHTPVLKKRHHILTKQTCRHQPHIKQKVKIINTIYKYGCFNNVYTCTNVGKLFEVHGGGAQNTDLPYGSFHWFSEVHIQTFPQACQNCSGTGFHDSNQQSKDSQCEDMHRLSEQHTLKGDPTRHFKTKPFLRGGKRKNTKGNRHTGNNAQRPQYLQQANVCKGRQCLKSESPQQFIYMLVNTSTRCTALGPGDYPAWSLQCQKHRINTKQGQGHFSSIRGAASPNMLLSAPVSSTSRHCSAKLHVNSGLKKKKKKREKNPTTTKATQNWKQKCRRKSTLNIPLRYPRSKWAFAQTLPGRADFKEFTDVGPQARGTHPSLSVGKKVLTVHSVEAHQQ